MLSKSSKVLIVLKGFMNNSQDPISWPFGDYHKQGLEILRLSHRFAPQDAASRFRPSTMPVRKKVERSCIAYPLTSTPGMIWA